MKFKFGDRVRIVNPDSNRPLYPAAVRFYDGTIETNVVLCHKPIRGMENTYMLAVTNDFKFPESSLEIIPYQESGDGI